MGLTCVLCVYHVCIKQCEMNDDVTAVFNVWERLFALEQFSPSLFPY